MAEGLKSVTYTKDGMMNVLSFEIPHEEKGERRDGLCVTIAADETTPAYVWMAKLRGACLSIAALIEIKGLDKNG